MPSQMTLISTADLIAAQDSRFLYKTMLTLKTNLRKMSDGQLVLSGFEQRQARRLIRQIKNELKKREGERGDGV